MSAIDPALADRAARDHSLRSTINPEGILKPAEGLVAG